MAASFLQDSPTRSLAAGGPAGALRALRLLREEFECDLGLLGLTATAQIGADAVFRPGREGGG